MSNTPTFIKKYIETVEMTSDSITAPAAKRVMKEDGYVNINFIVTVSEYENNLTYYEAVINTGDGVINRFIFKKDFDLLVKS